MSHVETLVDLFMVMRWAGVVLLVAIAIAAGLLLSGRGSDAAHTDWPREDWR